jgi:zinc D-Ala-D-Ala carboxypeptidase
MPEFPKEFPLAELVRSDRATRNGIDNTPSPEHEEALLALVTHVLLPLRKAMNGPIKVTSGYRSPKLNADTPGSSITSQHSHGQAADIVTGGSFTNAAMFDYIRKNLPFDQLILEFPDKKGEPRWVHVSYRGAKRRGQVLVANKNGGATLYAPYK